MHRTASDPRWHVLLHDEITRRLGADPADASDPRANAVIAAASGCVEAALIAWTSDNQPHTLAEILDRAMGAAFSPEQPGEPGPLQPPETHA